MNNMLTKWLSALLIAALFMTPVAMMEETPAGEPVAAETETQTEDVPEVVPEDVPEKAPEETDDVPEAAVIPEAVDAVVTEACDIDLDGVTEDALPVEASDEAQEGDAPTFEAEIVEESLDDLAEFEAAEEAPAPEPEGEAVAEETAEASAKAMAEAAGEIPIDAAHFPDAGFRQSITWYDKDSNGYLSANERDLSSEVSMNGKQHGFDYPLRYMIIRPSEMNISIQSLAGIENFNVQFLLFETNAVTALDISNILLPDLVWLEIMPDQQLTSVKIGNQPKLEVLFITEYDRWTSNLSGDLDLTGCPSMRYAYLGHINNLKKVYINPNSELSNLKFDGYFTEGDSIPLKKAAKHYKHRKYGWEGAPYGLLCPHNTKVITNTYIPATGVDQIACAGKRAKAAVNAGTTFQINPGAKAGKKFKSSKKKVATVDSNGIVTAKAKGKTKITFKVGKKKRTLTPAVPEGTNPGGFKWKSSNKKVATVNNGVVTFKKAGKVTITCTTVRGKKKARVTFAVSK